MGHPSQKELEYFLGWVLLKGQPNRQHPFDLPWVLRGLDDSNGFGRQKEHARLSGAPTNLRQLNLCVVGELGFGLGFRA